MAAKQASVRDLLEELKQALAASESRFQQVFLHSADGVLIVSETGVVQYANPAAETLLGRTLEQLRGVLFGIPSVVFEKAELDILHSSGRIVIVEMRATHLASWHGEGAYLIVLRDISDQRRTEEALRRSEEHFARIFNASPLPISISRLEDGCYLDVNPSFLRLTGYRQEEVLSCTSSDLQIWVDPQDRVLMVEALHERCGLSEYELKLRTKAGQVRDVLLSAEIIEVDHTPCVLAIMNDITERKRVEDALQQANEKLVASVSKLEQYNRETTLINEMGDMFQSCFTLEEAYRVVAQYARQLFPGHSGALFIVNNAHDTIEPASHWGDAPPDEGLLTPNACWGLRRGQMHLALDPLVDLVCDHVSMEARRAASMFLCIPMIAQGETMGMFHLRGSRDGSDLEHLKNLAVSVSEHIALALANLKLRSTLRVQAVRDPLTGLYNRRYMQEALDRELRRAGRHRRPMGLVMLDIDNFKTFNDRFGHEAGDILLRALGRLLQTGSRAEDVPCRYGGEEFTLILPETSLENTWDRCEQLREQVKRLKVEHRGQVLDSISISLGIASFPQHGGTPDALLRAADMALIRAKSDGRDRIVIAA